MDLDWLRSYLAVARHRSFTSAARELHLTQPGVSRQIQKLEREVGVPLLVRGQGPLTLTPAGERFLTFAEETVERYERLLRDLRSASPMLAGELRIVASTTPGEFIVPGLVAAFTQRFPDVHAEVMITDSTTVLQELRAGRWDIGFSGVMLRGEGLRYDAIAQDEIVLIAPVDHTLAGRGEVTLDDLAGQPFIEREDGSGTLISLQRAVASQGLRLPAYRRVMVLSSTDAIISAVERGYGMGWVSSLALAHRRPGSVATLRVRGLTLRRPLYLVRQTARPLPPVPAAFADWVRDTSRTAPPATE